MRKLLLLLSLCLPAVGAFAQASPFNLNIFKTQSFTATGQTGAVIQLNGLLPGVSTVGSSYASGTITVGGTAITTVSFQVMGSSDNGATFYVLPVFSVASPTSPPVSTVTATAAGLYQFSLAGLSHVKFVTTGTFTATSVTLILTASPNASISRNGSGGAVMSLTSPDSTIDIGLMSGAATLDLNLASANTWTHGMTIRDGLTVDQIAISADGVGFTFPQGSQIFEDSTNGLFIADDNNGGIRSDGGSLNLLSNAANLTSKSSDGTNSFNLLQLLGGGSTQAMYEAAANTSVSFFGTDDGIGNMDSSNTYETQIGAAAVTSGGNVIGAFVPKIGVGDVTTTVSNTNIKLLGDVSTSVRPAIDIRTFGAKMDGVTDDTAAINNAITAAHRSTVNCGLGSTAPTASCTGVVLIPNGATVASQIVMQNNVTLAGTGWNNSIIIQKAGSNENLIVGTNPATDQRFTIRDLFINGNASAQTGTGDCIHFDSTGSLADSTRSPRHTLQNIVVANCKQDAISLQGDAGSEYAYNVKGMNSGRYGLNINVFDSHADVCEFAQNGVAGVFTGPNGNGSIASCKIWGNGTGTVGTGVLLNAPNYRLVNNDIQDNFCMGIVATSVANETLEANYLDGNGQTGGGLGCAALVLNNVTNSKISGTINGIVDAGQSDFGIVFQGTNTQNIIEFTINNDKVAQVSGSVGSNMVILNGNVSSSATYAYNNGSIWRFFSDTATTETASMNGSSGQINVKQFNTGTSGFSVFAVGGPNNFDFSTNQNFMGINAGGGNYQVATGCTGGGCPASAELQFKIPIQVIPTGTQPTCSTATEGTFWYTVGSGTVNGLTQMCQNQKGSFLWVTVTPSTNQPRATFSGFTGTTFTSGAIGYGGSYTPSAAIAVTGVDLHLDTSPVGCTTLPQTSVYDETGPTVITGSTITMVNGTADYHVTLSTNSAAGHRLAFGTTVQGVGCTTNPTSAHFNVEYVMQ